MIMKLIEKKIPMTQNNKFNAKDIVKIIWGDNDRKIYGNMFYHLGKNFQNKFTPIVNGNIRFEKSIILEELHSHGFSCPDIQKIRELVISAIREELFELRSIYHIPPTDIEYNDTTFGRHSLSVLKPELTKVLNAKSRRNAEHKISKWLMSRTIIVEQESFDYEHFSSGC